MIGGLVAWLATLAGTPNVTSSSAALLAFSGLDPSKHVVMTSSLDVAAFTDIGVLARVNAPAGANARLIVHSVKPDRPDGSLYQTEIGGRGWTFWRGRITAPKVRVFLEKPEDAKAVAATNVDLVILMDKRPIDHPPSVPAEVKPPHQ